MPAAKDKAMEEYISEALRLIYELDQLKSTCVFTNLDFKSVYNLIRTVKLMNGRLLLTLLWASVNT